MHAICMTQSFPVRCLTQANRKKLDCCCLSVCFQKMFKTKNVWYANLGKHFTGMISYQKIFWFDKKPLGNESKFSLRKSFVSSLQEQGRVPLSSFMTREKTWWYMETVCARTLTSTSFWWRNHLFLLSDLNFWTLKFTEVHSPFWITSKSYMQFLNKIIKTLANILDLINWRRHLLHVDSRFLSLFSNLHSGFFPSFLVQQG